MCMRKTNPIFAGVAAVALAATMVPAFALAADINGTSAATTTGETQVKYVVAEGYTWSVPAEIDFGQNKGANSTQVTVTADGKSGNPQAISVTKNVIAKGKMLQITAEGTGTNGAFTISTTDGATLSYAVKAGSAPVTPKTTPVLAVLAGTDTGSADLTFTLTTANGTSEVAGNYTGKVTYTAAVVDQA